MITAIIVDDEKSGRETLAFILERHFSTKINILGMGSNLNEGVQLIKKYNPNVVFLDMEMPNELGLNILKKVEMIDFEIVVTTNF